MCPPINNTQSQQSLAFSCSKFKFTSKKQNRLDDLVYVMDEVVEFQDERVGEDGK
jgi:hypothetical protein